MNDDLKKALMSAMRVEYAWIEQWNDADYKYDFSNEFLKNMDKICKKAKRKYISIGRFRLTKATVAIAIMIMIMALAGCGYVVHQAVINWNEMDNEEQGAIDILFNVDDPDDTLPDVGFVRPAVPDGYEITGEEKGGDSYRIEYVMGDHYIIYRQMSSIEDMSLTIDSEDNEFKKIEILGNKGYVASKYGIQSITWSDGIYLYDISSNIEMSQLISIANSIGK